MMSRGFSTKFPRKEPPHSTSTEKQKQLGRTQFQAKPDEPHEANAAPDITGNVAICKDCHAIYQPKRWHLDEAAYQKLQQDPEVTRIVCPSCQAIAAQDFRGQVTLKGASLAKHREQILNTIYNEEAHLRMTNPHSRIGLVQEEDDQLVVWTVNEFLADRIGKELKKAFAGSQTEITHLPRERFTRVVWWRE